MTEKFDVALDNFLDKWQIRIDAWYSTQYKNLTPPTLRFKKGRKYVKISKCEGSSLLGSVEAFIDMQTGDIFKSASCSAPAKHARGSIFDEDPLRSLDEAGYVRYLRV